ncbi:hypothetical protein L3X38_037857 [Prunus dulcis]|uniref:Pathogenesis-related thaumatin superfamily protein n=1 Tax=Prunus dulcis TaxID=3755 RepID=A0AAD4V471_PRUDU|nr:hypothetical protein L3X38_037857 [Prunus dulcis]
MMKTLVVVLSLSLTLLSFEGAHAATMSFKNKCPYTVWPASFGNPQLSTIGFELASQLMCNGKTGIPPATLAEFTIAAGGGQDFYDVSLVDGFNLRMSVTPQGGSQF